MNVVILVLSYIFIIPVAQSDDSGGFGGLDSAQLQRHNLAAELPEGSQALVIPPYCWFISLKVLSN